MTRLLIAAAIVAALVFGGPLLKKRDRAWGSWLGNLDNSEAFPDSSSGPSFE